MSFKNFEHKKLPRQEDILSKVGETEIYKFYLKLESIPYRTIRSPLRNDNTPSFSLFNSGLHSRLLWKDFATGEVGNCFTLVMRLYNLNKITDAFNCIARDMNLSGFSFDPAPRRVLGLKVNNEDKIKLSTKKVNVKVKVRPWSSADKKYWWSYGLTPDLLEYCGVFPISHYFLNDYVVQASDIAYAYVEYKDGIQSFKIYQPYDSYHKWVNNNDYSTWELWDQLPKKGNNLIITSSRKDAMVIKNLFPSNILTSCAMQCENIMPKVSVIEELKNRFKNIYVLYDNDFDATTNWGRYHGQRLSENYNLIQIEISDVFCIKDISDFYKAKGNSWTHKLIREMTQQ
jgi:hypothetical protein